MINLSAKGIACCNTPSQIEGPGDGKFEDPCDNPFILFSFSLAFISCILKFGSSIMQSAQILNCKNCIKYHKLLTLNLPTFQTCASKGLLDGKHKPVLGRFHQIFFVCVQDLRPIEVYSIK